MGVLTEEFVLPLYPKVGFWTIRVVADGQASLHRNRISHMICSFFSFLLLVLCCFVLIMLGHKGGGDIIIHEKIKVSVYKLQQSSSVKNINSYQKNYLILS